MKLFHLQKPLSKWRKRYVRMIKGALDNFSLIPNFFFKKVEIFISLEVYTYVVDCMLNLTCSFNSVTKIYAFFFQQPFLKVDF